MKIRNSQNGQASMIVGGVVILAVILIGIVYFMMQKGTNTNTTTDQTTTVPTAVVEQPSPQPTTIETGTPAQGKKVTFQVDGSSFKYVPATLSVNEGDTVTIKFVNTKGFHDFVIDEFNVKTKQIAENQSEEVTFVASKKGSFEYYCSVGNHRQMGMKGTLTVK